jgi:hypothetical protein
MINAKNMETKNTGAKPTWLIFSLERISAINKPQSMIDSVAPASDGWLNEPISSPGIRRFNRGELCLQLLIQFRQTLQSLLLDKN